MLDPGLLQLAGGKADTKYVPLHTTKFIAGLQTQRSPFAPIDTRYGTRYLGGKPDTLLSGSNCEISNKLTLQRRPGLLPYGTASIPPPLAFYEWDRSVPSSILTVVDTASALYRYSPTAAGIYFNKATRSSQTNVVNVVNTLYCGDGVDLFKVVGPNLLIQSNTFSSTAWVRTNVASISSGQSDPVGGTAASAINWATSGASTQIIQGRVLNYTPVVGNTFTFSVWMKIASGAESVSLEIQDQVPSIVATNRVAVTTTWTKYEVTGTCTAGSATSGAGSITVLITNPSSTTPLLVYGAQLEIGGPSTPTEITTNLPQGVYNWGIKSPLAASNDVNPLVATTPQLFFSAAGNPWIANFTYPANSKIVDSNGNLQQTNAGGTSGTNQPLWSITQETTTTDNSVIWDNKGPLGLSPRQGYQYYYAFMCSLTGHLSPVSPISANSGVHTGTVITVEGVVSTDPQVDKIAIFRNTDGGPFFYQLAIVPNFANAGSSWSYADSTQDSLLNTSIFAPVAGLNTPPPAGLVAMEFHSGRLWAFVGQNLYYSSLSDNAAALNVVLNGVPPECWSPANVIPLDANGFRSVSTSSGLIVMTSKDFWIVGGQDLTSFYPQKVLRGHGIRSYNAVDIDGSNIQAYLADRQFLDIGPGSGSVELGFAIGDQLESNVDPTSAYLARHIAGTSDNAIYLGDGKTGWYRLNPNQIGASLGGEQSPVWSAFATLNGGAIGAIASIETSPGIHQLLVGQSTTGVVLVRDLNTFSDNGSTYAWNAVIGSIVLATTGQLAETESISVESLQAVPTVGVLLDEISGSFEVLANHVSDPPQFPPSSTVNSNRWYLAQGGTPPVCKHLQIQLSGAAAATKDEILTISIRGVLVAEQT